MVAPMALYPDPVVSQMLMASTYPLEIVEAARWMKANPGLKEAALEAKLKEQDWDASVKSLCGFPDVLKQMDENLDWTQDLGDAFLAQKTELMDTIQRMRGKAYDSGNLKTTEQQVVTQQPDKIIVIQPADPEVIYVPTYSSTVVYGGWSYPSYYYPPMYYPPPYGYGAMAFTVGVVWGAAIWGGCNWGWGGSDVDIDINRQNNFNRNTNIDGGRNQVNPNNRAGGKQSWQHDASHRGGVNYRDNKTAQQYRRELRVRTGSRATRRAASTAAAPAALQRASAVPARPPARSAAATPGPRRAIRSSVPQQQRFDPRRRGSVPEQRRLVPRQQRQQRLQRLAQFQHGSLREQPRRREPWRRRHEPRRRRRRRGGVKDRGEVTMNTAERLRVSTCRSVGVAVSWPRLPHVRPAPAGTFATPEEAMQALADLAGSGDTEKTEEMFGADSLDLFRFGRSRSPTMRMRCASRR